MNALSRDHEEPPACAERPGLRPFAPASGSRLALAPIAAHTVPKAAPLAPCPLDGAFGARPFPTPGRAPRNSGRAGGPHDLGVLPAHAVRAARICSPSFPIGARLSPWQTASTERHASDPETTGHSSHRHGAARRCSTSISVGAHLFTANAPGATDHFSSPPPPSSASPGHAAVISRAAADRGRGVGATSALTASVADKPLSSARLPVHLLASVPAPHDRAATGTSAHPSFFTPTASASPLPTALASRWAAGTRTASPVAASPRVGLIEQSTRPHGLSIRPPSTKAGRDIPAGITQGERD